MNYNHFTIDYIKSIKRNLKIEIDDSGNAIFFPDSITNNDLINLKDDLKSIWDSSASAINILKDKHESIIQSGLFGLVNDLDKAIKIGFLTGDRVVLIDCLFERILLRREPNKIDRTKLGVVTNVLVQALPLAESGRIVIIPSPFNWNHNSKKIIEEVSNITPMTPDLMSLLNMLSITKLCKLCNASEGNGIS